jgi:hypothetical protein
VNGNYNISRCNNMQGTGIYSLHTAMCALIRGGGGEVGGERNLSEFSCCRKAAHAFCNFLHSPLPPSQCFNEGNQIHKFMSSPDTGTVINYGSGSDFLTNYGSGYVPGSTSQKLPVPVPVPVPVPQHWYR